MQRKWNTVQVRVRAHAAMHSNVCTQQVRTARNLELWRARWVRSQPTSTHVPSSHCWGRSRALTCLPPVAGGGHKQIPKSRMLLKRAFPKECLVSSQECAKVRQGSEISKGLLNCRVAGNIAALGSQKLNRKGLVRTDDLSKREPLDRINWQSSLLRPNTCHHACCSRYTKIAMHSVQGVCVLYMPHLPALRRSTMPSCATMPHCAAPRYSPLCSYLWDL